MSQPEPKVKTLYGVDRNIALWRVASVVMSFVWRTNLRQHINGLIAEAGAKVMNLHPESHES